MNRSSKQMLCKIQNTTKTKVQCAFCLPSMIKVGKTACAKQITKFKDK